MIVLPKPQQLEGVCGDMMLNAESGQAPALPGLHVALARIRFGLKAPPMQTSKVKLEVVLSRTAGLV